MKSKFLLIIFSMLIFISCSNPSNSSNDKVNKKHSIIFNNIQQFLGEEFALAVINSDGTGFKKIGQGFTATPSGFSVSEDGTIAVYTDIKNYKITITNLKDMTSYQLDENAIPDHPLVSPNAKYIAFVKAGSSNSPELIKELYVMDIDGSNKNFLGTIAALALFQWSDDSKGIYYTDGLLHPSAQSPAYYIDRRGENQAIEVESPFDEKLDIISLDEFTRADWPEGVAPDVVGFSSRQYNKYHNKAWFLHYIIDYSSRPLIVMHSYLCRYDLKTKTEIFLLYDEGDIYRDNLISWSPDEDSMVIFTPTGIEMVRVDGSNDKILDFNHEVSDSYFRLIEHQWIPELD